MERIGKISSEMAQLQEHMNAALIRTIPYQDPQEAERLKAEGNNLMSTLSPSVEGHQDLAKESQRIDHNSAVVRVGQMGLMRSV